MHGSVAMLFLAVSACLGVFVLSMSITTAVLLATVIGISDGDTLTALTADEQQLKVRIAAIDAPERHQPYGARSRQSLATLCFKQPAEIRLVSRDRYGRTVAAVSCQGQDAGANQIAAGMAWSYPQYARQFPHYSALQEEASAARRGLWSMPDPIPPWEWRRRPAR
jgi:endonuclease YncB( thermonuclease family)